MDDQKETIIPQKNHQGMGKHYWSPYASKYKIARNIQRCPSIRYEPEFLWSQSLPVHLEWVNNPTKQDHIDLQKLLMDAPADWPCKQSTDPTQALLDQAHQANGKIAAGRFNDRLIATALITPAESESYEISQLLVRRITRERGVARQMLVRLTQWADQEGLSLTAHDENHEYRTLLEFGFLYERPTWKRAKSK